MAASVVRCVFPCLSCSTQLMKEAGSRRPPRGQEAALPTDMEVHQPGNCDMWSSSSNTLLQENITASRSPTQTVPSNETRKCSKGMWGHVIKKKLKVEAVGSQEAYGHFGKAGPHGCIRPPGARFHLVACKKFMTCSIKNVFSALNMLHRTNGQYQLDLCWERCGLFSIQANLHLLW